MGSAATHASQTAGIGIDLGGTHITGLLVRGDGHVLARRRRDTPAREGAEAVLWAMRTVAVELLGEAAAWTGEPPVRPSAVPVGEAEEESVPGDETGWRRAESVPRARSGQPRAEGTLRVVGLGLGIPGPIDAETGVCLFSPNLGWRGLDVGSYFRQAFSQGSNGLAVLLDNDVRAATLGEAWLGAGRGFRTFVCLTIGTGIGSGIILNGRLWRGAGSSAGELGHIPVVRGPDAPLCGCGRRGCLEAVASGSAIAREAAEAASRGEAPALAGVSRPTARDVAEAARRGDQAARAILGRAGAHLGTGIATVVNLLNPEAVIVGGGVAGAWDLLGPVVEHTVRERAFPPNLVSLRGIFPAVLGEDAGAIGAASLVLAPRETL